MPPSSFGATLTPSVAVPVDGASKEVIKVRLGVPDAIGGKTPHPQSIHFLCPHAVTEEKSHGDLGKSQPPASPAGPPPLSCLPGSVQQVSGSSHDR